jgi:hypothetical protein
MGLRYLGSTVARKESPIFTNNGSASVTHKYLSRIASSDAGAVKQYYTGVMEMGISGLRCMFGYHL